MCNLTFNYINYFFHHINKLPAGNFFQCFTNISQTFYGFYTSLWSIIPALIVMVLWLSIESSWLANSVIAELPEAMRQLPKSQLYLVLNDIKNVVNGTTLSTQADQVILDAAKRYQRLELLSHNLLSLVTIALSIGGIWFSSQRINKDHRARNAVEKVMNVMMVICSTIATARVP